MNKHNWDVGVLKELDPAQATILGYFDALTSSYNENKGQSIALRLRFEQGFRDFSTIRDVMLHELTHMVHRCLILLVHVHLLLASTMTTSIVSIANYSRCIAFLKVGMQRTRLDTQRRAHSRRQRRLPRNYSVGASQ